MEYKDNGQIVQNQDNNYRIVNTDKNINQNLKGIKQEEDKGYFFNSTEEHNNKNSQKFSNNFILDREYIRTHFNVN